MTPDPIEVIRDFILQESYTAEQEREALAALETVRSNYVPLELLPEGWEFISLSGHGNGEPYGCRLWKTKDRDYRVYGRGTTPNAAFLAAVKQIGDV